MTTSPKIIEDIAERTRMLFDLQTRLIHWLDTNDKPMPNARKYFARKVVLEFSDNPAWLSKATKAIYQHWQEKNANRGRGEFSEAVNASMN